MYLSSGHKSTLVHHNSTTHHYINLRVNSPTTMFMVCGRP